MDKLNSENIVVPKGLHTLISDFTVDSEKVNISFSLFDKLKNPENTKNNEVLVCLLFHRTPGPFI